MDWPLTPKEWATPGLKGRTPAWFPKYLALACSNWLDTPEPGNR